MTEKYVLLILPLYDGIKSSVQIKRITYLH
jgi:hypothetical protein